MKSPQRRFRDSESTVRPSRRQVIQAGGGFALASGVLAAGRLPSMAQDEQISIDFMNWWVQAREPIMDAIIEEFQQDFPNVTVNNSTQTWDRRDELVVTALAGGDPPEVIMATRQEIVNFAASGAIAPITKYIEAQDLDLERYYESEIASLWWEDELYALPMPTAGGETGLSFINARMFEEAGLDPETPPETWADLDAAAEVLTKRADNGALEVAGAWLDVTGTTFLAQLYCNGGALYSEDLRTVTFNDDRGKEALQWLYDFVERHYGGQQNVLDLENTLVEGQDAFRQEKTAIAFSNVSQFFHLRTTTPDLAYNVGFRPYNGDNPDATSQGIAGLTFGWGYVVPTGLDEATEEAAFNFVKRITYDEAACSFMFEQERPSPLIDCNENPEYAENNPHWETVLQSLENDVPMGVVPPQTEILSTVNDYVDLVAFGEMGVEDALDQAAEETQAILDEYWSSAS